jgi:hypothetical protein
MEEIMSRQIILLATVAALAVAGPSHAQMSSSPNDVPMPPVIELPPTQSAQTTTEAAVPGTNSASALLNGIVQWLSRELDLPASYDHPRIELASPAKMAAVLRRRMGVGWQTSASLESNDQAMLRRVQEIAALYEDASRTIYLPEGWTGRTPSEVSVLVHEMVHHLQNLSGQKYECAAAREKPAYTAQQKWLALSGRNFFEEFDTDPMTLLVRTACGF